ncbi:hypothetical protein [Pelomonas sp. KK5]|uniref:S10 family serine carboxypeptidase-like protein n=1 Tax=Pelomonas sp. KK5 TaxID=1855730 RepID=UPI0009FB55EE|nr:hypothetical protein [Pelomonas sp. KK5]
MNLVIRRMALACAASLCCLVAAAADPSWLQAPVIAQQQGYTSTFFELPLPDATAPVATISATMYTKPPAAGKAARPLLFLFNGGPGASSTPLHLNGLGPKRYVDKQLQPNPFTVLDTMDLVFIDPVGTGFSQVLEAGKSRYWATEADARAAAALIRHIVKATQREGAPVYVGGQSYGGYRLATLMKFTAELPPLSGIVFISPMLDATLMADAPGNELVHGAELPSMAVAAWQHGKGDRAVQGETVQQVFERATAFARDEYVPALLEGAKLPADRQKTIAARLSALLGLPVDEIVRQRLRPGSEDFLTHVLGQDGKRLGRLDTRVIGSSAPPPAGKPTNDPSLVVTAPVANQLTPTEAYFRNELNVPITRKYVPLSFTVNGGWNFFDASPTQEAFYLNATRHVATAMAANPQLRVLYVGGYYDMATPVGAATYALEHAGLPMERVRMQVLPGAHSPYDDDANLARFTAALREFVR